jgi:outer membrane biosynthesis protein TonB
VIVQFLSFLRRNENMKRKIFGILVVLSLIMGSLGLSVVVAQEPTGTPAEEVTLEPTEEATAEPTEEATVEPTEEVTEAPTEEATEAPTEEATVEPTEEVTEAPTEEATVEPTEEVTEAPTEEATVEPTEEVTEAPTEEATTEAPPEERVAEPSEEPISASDVSASIAINNAVTSFQVQNKGTSTAEVQSSYYKEDGNLDYSETFNVAAGSSVNIYQPNVTGLSNGFKGNVVLQSTQDIGAVVGEVFNWNNGKSGAAQYSGLASDEVGSNFYLPNITKKFGGGQYSTKIIVQNVKDTSTTVTVHYYNSSGSPVTAATESHAVAGNGSYTFEQEANGNLPNGFSGGAVVSAGSTSDQIAVIVNVFNVEGRLTAYNGFRDGATMVYAPTILRYSGGGRWTTSFQIMALESGSTSVTINYVGSPNKQVKYDGVQNPKLSQYQSISRFQGDGGPDTDLGASWFGGLVVQADKKVVLIVNQANYAGALGASAYNGFAAGANKFFLPSVSRQFGGGSYTSSFQVMNVGTGSNAEVTVKYYNPGVSTPFKTVTYKAGGDGPAIAQYKSISRYLAGTTEPKPDGADISAGWTGSVVVESTNGVPVAVIGAQSGAVVNGDGATQYNGVK